MPDIEKYLNKRQKDFRNFLIMTAIAQKKPILRMGGIGEFTYTNLKEAVMDSLRKNFSFIEIDLLKTSDGHLLAAHDWKHFKALTGLPENDKAPMTLDEAMRLKIRKTLSPLDGNGIRNIMKTNRDFILVTDKIADYDLLLKEIPFPERIIVEVFSPEDYLKALKAGIKYPAYCIWGKKEYQIASRFRFPIVTMSAGSFFNSPETMEMVRDMHNSGVTILLFGTGFQDWDKETFIREHLGKTVSKIYTDRFSPSDMPR